MSATATIQTASLPELNQQIKERYEAADQIEKKYGTAPITSADDLAQVKRLLSEIDELEAHRSNLEDAEQRRSRILQGLDKATKPAVYVPQGAQGEDRTRAKQYSPGDQFIRSNEYRDLKQKGVFHNHLNRIDFSVPLQDGTSLLVWKRLAPQMEDAEQKALVYGGSATVGGALVANDVRPGFLDILQREITVLDLIPRVATDSDTIEYVRETTYTNNAAMVAEATATTGDSGLKPESVLAFAAATAAVRTLAHWIPVTNRMLADAPAIRGIINSRLLTGLTLALEDQILTGNGTGENFTGILNAGILTQGIGSDNVLDAIFKARTQVRVTGRARPNAVVLHPNDWEAVRLSRENAATGTLGGYLMGPPSQVGATTVWGLPVVESEGITENTGLVGDFAMGATLFDREQSAVRVGLIDDQFVRNLQTILAELRAALVIWRTSCFAAVTGI